MRTILVLGVAGLLAAPAIAADLPTLTQDSGAPVGDNQHSKTAGPDGGVLLEDFHLIEKLARFDRERIPERVVHARGTGAHGSFVASADFSEYTKASLFAVPGKETPVFVRFSTVIHPKGSPESLRDPRGFATKFYTDQGNWDLVGNDLPVFFIRDAIKFPDMVHSLKPSPVTNIQDPNRFFDFFSHIPESTNMLTYLYSDLGTPASYREMDGFGVHAFRLVNAKSDVVFAKFHWKSQQGVKTLSAEEAAAVDFNYATKDLYAAIRAGNSPKWDLYVQLLKPEEVAKLNYNAFDATKIWDSIPETKLGTMTLNRVPENFFQSTELAAFSPGVMVPGIEASPDRLLQGRLFSYADTQRYRIGANYQALEANRPKIQVANNNQDGALNFVERTGEVNYQPSRATGDNAYADVPQFRYTPYKIDAVAEQAAIKHEENFRQAGALYRSLSKEQQDHLVKNLAGDLGQVRSQAIKETVVSNFYKADKEYGTRLAKAVGVDVKAVEKLAANN
jgi:catalase